MLQQQKTWFKSQPQDGKSKDIAANKQPACSSKLTRNCTPEIQPWQQHNNHKIKPIQENVSNCALLFCT